VCGDGGYKWRGVGAKWKLQRSVGERGEVGCLLLLGFRACAVLPSVLDAPMTVEMGPLAVGVGVAAGGGGQ
jgi:hypothetical protein